MPPAGTRPAHGRPERPMALRIRPARNKPVGIAQEAVFLALQDQSVLMDIAQHGAEDPFVGHQFTEHPIGEFAFTQLREHTEKQHIVIARRPMRRCHRRHHHNHRADRRKQREQAQHQQGRRRRAPAGLADCQGEDDKGRTQQDTRLLVGHLAEREIGLNRGTDEMDRMGRISGDGSAGRFGLFRRGSGHWHSIPLVRTAMSDSFADPSI